MGGDKDIKHSEGGPSVFGALICTVMLRCTDVCSNTIQQVGTSEPW